ncbi:MAG: hypothetical protein AAF206_12815 [Bacteroidota bacterium]
MKRPIYVISFLFSLLYLGIGCGDSQTNSAGKQSASPPLSEGRDLDEGSTDDLISPREVNIPDGIQKISWEDLADVRFEQKLYPEINETLLFPNFGENVKALAGKKVAISGYVMPLSTNNDHYALSANPFSSCFFCGGAGPETVLELDLVSYNTLYFTDEFTTFSGTLRLNDQDIDRLNYILEACVEL